MSDPPPAAAQNGKRLKLTIDLPLQQRIYEILGNHVKRWPYSTGGAAVILDVPSREILAIVSYPSYDPNITTQQWLAMTDDELHQPFIFRPLQMRYPPGSTVKPMLLAAGLTDGSINADTQVTCAKCLDPQHPDHFRCLAAHGTIGPIFAIQHSCNIFFYKLGAKMGTKRLAWWMEQFGLGRESGTGFPQESKGHLPEHVTLGTAMLGAIGQSECDATPVQIANMMATIASGIFRPVTLLANDPRPRPTHGVVSPEGHSISEGAWRLARDGMYHVVNVVNGTAYGPKRAMIRDAGDYILIGKTGSGTGQRRPVQRKYTCHFKDGSSHEEVASSLRELQGKYPDATIQKGEAASLCPPPGTDPTHAWFAGYLTTKQHYLESNNGGRLNVAIAVIIEFAGHGGEAAAPAARDMMAAVIERAGEHVGEQDQESETELEVESPTTEESP